MANNLSPAVTFTEVDASQSTPSVTTSVGAMVMVSSKGPVNVLTQLTSPSDLINIFGAPDDTNYTHWFTVNAFLQQSNSAYVVRIEDVTKAVAGVTVGLSASGLGNLVLSTPTTKPTASFPLGYNDIKDHEAKIDYNLPPGTGPGELDNAANNLYNEDVYHFYGIGPGTYYDQIAITVVNAADFYQLQELKVALSESTTQDATNAIADMYYNGTPSTTAMSGQAYLSDSLIKYDIFTPPVAPSVNWFINTSMLGTLTAFENGPTTPDEAVLIVWDESGNPQETYMFSNDQDATDATGNNLYGPTQVNGNSSYLYFFIGSDPNASYLLPVVSINQTFLGGADELTGQVPGTGLADLTSEFLTGWETFFTNSETLSIDLLLDPDYVDVVKEYLDQVAAQIRQDCMAVLQVPLQYMLDVSTYRPISAPYTAMKNYVQNTLNVSSSYSAIYGQYFQVYDQFAQKNRWVPCAGFVAGAIAYTDYSNAPWFAPAGLNRGTISGVVNVAINPNKAQRDVLYYNRINSIPRFQGDGIVIWGQKTMINEASAFNRVNVRRLFLYLEKTIVKMARSYLFEFNDSNTQASFRGVVNPFLAQVKAGRGVYDFLVVCDSSNNTPEIVDSNQFVGNILVKPTRVAEYINLTFTAVATDVSFSEVIVPSSN